MRSIKPWLLPILLLVPTTGCGVFRCIEQWKCDHLGMCHGGVAPNQPACNLPPTLAPQPGCQSQGCQTQMMVPNNLVAPPAVQYGPGPMMQIDPYAN